MSAQPDNHDVEIIAVAVTFQVLMTAAFIVRLISVRIRHKKYALDDVLLGIAFVAASLQTIIFALSTRILGLGHHMSTLTTHQLIWFEKVHFGSAFAQAVALAFAKLALIILLHRIFRITRFHIVAWVLAIIVILWFIGSILAATLNCVPIQRLWNPKIPGHCGNQLKIQLAEPVPWIVTDFAVLVAPLPMIKNLHLPARQRWGLAGLFLLGGVTCVASCIRYSTVWYSPEDVTYEVHTASCWNIIEANLGVIVVSLIVSRPVLGRVVPNNIEQKLHWAWTKMTPSFARKYPKNSWFSSIPRVSTNPPVIPSFTDSELKLATMTHESQDDGDLSTASHRAEMERYSSTV